MLHRLKASLRRFHALVALKRAAQALLARIRRHAGRAIRGALIRRYLSAHAVHKLQLGAGTNPLPGWLNTDGYPATFRVVSLDARAPLPFRDQTFDYLFTEHHIEHMTFPEGRRMLREGFRVLKRGGRIRVATPDLEVLLRLRCPPHSPIQDQYIHWIVDAFLPDVRVYSGLVVINNAFRNWGHRFLYDEATLRSALEEAGFVGVVRYPMGVSDDVHLRGIECHGVAVGNVEMNRFETMVLEARRAP